jgi:hypothetical protein
MGATNDGLAPAGEGWFVVGLGEAAWERKGEMSYPENEAAARFGASASSSTRSSREAYADRDSAAAPERSPWPMG